MITKKTSKFGTIVGDKDVDVLDNPAVGSPKICQLRPGRVVQVISKPNKKFIGIGITNSIIGFIPKDNLKVE